MSYRIPLNVEVQTCLLVEAGVAAMVLRFLPHMVKGATNVALEQCGFWAERMYEQRETGLPLPGGGLQVVIQYPRYTHSGLCAYYGYGIPVTIDEKPLPLGDGEYLSPKQIALVEQSAGPPESWLPGPLRSR